LGRCVSIGSLDNERSHNKKPNPVKGQALWFFDVKLSTLPGKNLEGSQARKLKFVGKKIPQILPWVSFHLRI
jgi:hypothetical protein